MLQSLPPIYDMLGLLLFVLLQDSQTDITVITPYIGHVRSTAVCLITGQLDRHYSHYPLYWTCQVYCCLSYYRIARQTLQSLPPIYDMLGLLLFVLLQDSQTDITVITPYIGHVRSTAVCLITGQPDMLQSLPPILDMLGLLLFVLLQDSQTDITVITPYIGHVRSIVVCLITGQPDRHYSHYPLYWTCQGYCCLSHYRVARQTLQSLPPILDMLGLLLFVLLQDSQTDITVITPYTGHVKSTAVCLITGQPDRHCSHYPLYWTGQVRPDQSCILDMFVCLFYYRIARQTLQSLPPILTCQVYCCLSYYRIARQTFQSLPPILDMLGLLLFVLLQDSQTDITVITPLGLLLFVLDICQVYWTCLSYYRIARQTLQSYITILDMLGLLLFVLLQDSQTDIAVITPYIGHVRSTVVCLITGQPDRHYSHYPLYWTCQVYCCLSYYRIARQTLQSLPPILDMLGLLLFVLLQDSQTDITVITSYTGHVRSTVVCLITGQPDRHYSHYLLYWTCQVYCCLSYYRIARQTLQSLPPILDMLGLLLFVLLQDSQTDIAVITPLPILDMLGLLLFVLLQDSQTDITVITSYTGHVRSTVVCLITGQPDRHYSHYPLYWTCQVYCCLSYYRIARQTLQSLPPILDMLGLLLFVLLQDSQTDITVITSYTGHVRSTAVCHAHLFYTRYVQSVVEN